MSTVILKLNQAKKIKGKDYPAGTVMAEFQAAKKFDAKDIDLAMQAGQLKVAAGVPKEEAGAPIVQKKDDKK